MANPRTLRDGTQLERVEAYVPVHVKTKMLRAATRANLPLSRWLEMQICTLLEGEDDTG